MVGGVSATRAANLETSGEALSKFVSRVDAVLRDLEGSAGNPTKVGAQTIRLTSLSSGTHKFDEAEGLYKQYDRVHQELTSLSRTLHLQVEATAIAVQGAHRGFDNLEEEQRRRFAEIQAQVREIQDAKDGKQRTGDGRTGMKA
jgi:Zn-dependent oligopeptidase